MTEVWENFVKLEKKNKRKLIKNQVEIWIKKMLGEICTILKELWGNVINLWKKLMSLVKNLRKVNFREN